LTMTSLRWVIIFIKR